VGVIDHVPLPDHYLRVADSATSPLTDDEREAFRDEIRHLVSGVKEESDLGGFEHPAIHNVHLVSFRGDSALTVTVYLGLGDLQTDAVALTTLDDDGEEIVSDDPHYLRDLGDEWQGLEHDLIGELVLLLDLPETPSELADYLLDGGEYGPCLVCNTRTDDSASFSVTASIPATTQRIYDGAEFELARYLGIPIDGSKY
jgi:hypothetical protein